jgi:puromycin-sensitive aminopeptidase
MTDVVRLQRFFEPARYELALKPNKKTMTFSGQVKISGHIVNNQTLLRLHSKDLNITAVSINRQPARFKLKKADDELHIFLPTTCQVGDIIINIRFKAAITTPLHGLYPCTSAKGEVFLVTQLESHHAREIFPCIDEPAAKAVFGLTITAPQNEVVIANTEPLLSQVSGKLATTRFKDTPPMSTYLLAFVIGNFRCRQIKTKDGVLIRAWASVDQFKHIDFSLSIAKKSLEFFNSYLKVPYPLNKLDLVALPDFAAGAMENWGLMTFRESCMLVDKQNTSLDAKQYVASVVAHEIAHQWFGDLVTMRWWNDLWLNEGFASWVEHLAVDHMFPDWHMWTQFLLAEQLPALRLDALKNTHAIEVNVPHPSEIRSIFDTISYAKGACMIHMLHEYLGDDFFRAGLQNYLKKYAYSTSTTDDLWESLELTSGLEVKKFMSAWTSQPGFPLLEVKLNKTGLHIKQNRFCADKTTGDKAVWPVPLLAPELPEKILETSKILLKKPKNINTFKLNVNQSGFYITRYWPKQYNRLCKLVANNKLSENDSLCLIADMLALTKIGKLPLLRLVKILTGYRQINSMPVWDSIAIALGDIRRVMGPEVRKVIKPMVDYLTSYQLSRLGWKEIPKESYFDKLLRPTILALADSADNEAVVAEAKKRFDKAKKADDIDKDLRCMVLISVSRRGDQKEFDKMLGMLRATNSAEDKMILADAITNFRQPALYNQALSLIRSDDVRIQNVIHWLINSLANPIARDRTWSWTKHNWQWLKENLADDISYPHIPVYVGRFYNDMNFLKEYREFFGKVTEPGLKRPIKQGVETIKLQAEWHKRDQASLLAWLTNFKPPRN